MKFIDAMVNLSFQEDCDGNEIYFPWGKFGKGYLLNDPIRKKEIIKFNKLSFTFGIILLSIFIFIIQPILLLYDLFLFDGLVALCISIFMILVTSNRSRKMIIGLPIANKKYSTNETLRKTVVVYPWWILWLGLLISIIILFISVMLILHGGNELLSILSIIVFGIVAFSYAYFIYIKFQKY